MFRGFIVLGIAYGIGWSQGYISGQNHTEELKDLIKDLRNSEETKEFFAKVALAMEELAARRIEEEGDDEDGDEVVDSEAEPLPPEELDKVN